MLRSEWKRVSRDHPCPVCGRPNPQHRSRWCTYTADGNVVCCMFTPSAVQLRNGGWLHRLQSLYPLPSPSGRVGRVSERPARLVAIDWPAKICQWEQQAQSRLGSLARALALPESVLRSLRVGWDGAAWIFPMYDADGGIIGARRRLPDGRKLSVRGGREGLFRSAHLEIGRTLYICEGPTDLAALLALGFVSAVARPSNVGGHDLLISVLRRTRPEQLVIFADRDADARANMMTLYGARRLLEAASFYGIAGVIVRPPPGIKDLRDWHRSGVCREDIEARIAEAI